MTRYRVPIGEGEAHQPVQFTLPSACAEHAGTIRRWQQGRYQRLSTSRTLATWMATSVYSFCPE